MPNIDLDLCVICQLNEANYDKFCNSCYLSMWDFNDEIAEIIGHVFTLDNDLYYAGDVIPHILEAVENLRKSIKETK